MAYFPAADSNDYIDTPDASPGPDSIRTIFTIVMYLRPDTWANGISNQNIFCYGVQPSNNFTCVFYLDPSGVPYFFGSKNGSSIGVEIDGTAVGYSDGQGAYLAVTRDGVFAGGRGKILKSLDGITWTDITTLYAGGSGGLYNTTETFRVGRGITSLGGVGFKGYIGNLRQLNAYNDPTSAVTYTNFNPSSYVSGITFNTTTTYGPNPQTWTIHGNASIVGPMV